MIHVDNIILLCSGCIYLGIFMQAVFQTESISSFKMWWRGINGRLIFTAIVLVLVTYTYFSIPLSKVEPCKQISKNAELFSSLPLWEQTLDFDNLNFSNETGNPDGTYLVPNYIHFVNCGGHPINYVQMVCILAAFKNQQPEKIFFHYNDNRTFTGKYWDVVENTPGFKKIVEFHSVILPDKIFGQPLSKEWRVWHGSDILRIKIMMKYGGVFLDNDCYLIRRIDDFRRFEISMNWDEGQFLGNQVIIAHKDARFLRRWLDCYRVYDETKWYYNGGERPTVEVLYKQPELLHRVKVLFGADNSLIYNFFQKYWPQWRSLYIIHLLIRHQYMLKSISDKATYPVEFDEVNIANYPITFREMAYDVYDIANIDWPKNII